jgi:hypothetical protein
MADISDLLSSAEKDSADIVIRPIPVGKRGPLRIEEVELKDTQSGGKRLAVKLTGVGPWKGVVFYENFNLKNANPKAVSIGLQQYTMLCQAAGHKDACPQTKDLHGCIVEAAILSHEESTTINENTGKPYLNERIGD